VSYAALRQPTLKDLDAMLEVWRVSNEDAGDARRGEVVKALELFADLVVVAEADGQVIGVILATTDGPPEATGHPKRLVVRPTHRRQGVGRSLVVGT
jgi:predicted N-acetyltransferase YhbS